MEGLISQGALPVKESKSTRTAVLDIDCGFPQYEKESVFFKEYRLKSLIHSLKSNFCRHRAEVVWDLSWRLIASGIDVPEPAGYFLKQNGPFCLAGYSFSKLIPASRHLAAAAEKAKEQNAERALGVLMDSIACRVASLHESGVIHGDLKWTNILVHECGSRFWLVDLDSARCLKRAPGPAAVAEDLARFIFGGMQAGVDGALGQRFLDKYSEHRNLNRKILDPHVDRLLGKFIKRHRF